MGQRSKNKLVLFGLISCLILGSVLFWGDSQQNNLYGTESVNVPFSSSQSTDPGNPHILYDDSSVYDYFNASTSYYYRTDNASLALYQVIWLQPQDAQDNFNLYLYNDSGFGELVTGSTRGAGYLDWVVFRPNASQFLYVLANALSGSSGFAFIEWEDSSTNLTVNGSVSSALSAPDSLEVYQVSLSNTSAYRFRLDVPSEGDFDLYLYRLDPGMGTNTLGSEVYSWAVGMGRTEIIANYTPPSSGDYALLVVRSSGSGTYTLSASSFPSAPRVLSDDVTLNESCETSTSYYYQTGNASSSYYHIVWLQPQDPQNDFDLFLYSDAEYSNYEISSQRGAGLLEWVAFRPSAAQNYYPEVYAQVGSSGNASIEWEDGSANLSVGNPVVAALSSTECVEVYEVALSNSLEYEFSLAVPTSGDFNLYLYYLTPGTETDYSGFSRSSTNVGNGTDELISNYHPISTGNYALVVARANGTGTFSLNATSIKELSDDSAAYESYSAFTSYHYRIPVASFLYYQVVWMQPTSPLDDFDLLLYSDENYSDLIGMSARGDGALDWIVFKPNTSSSFYPTVDTSSGSSGNAYIEWEDSSESLYFSVSGALSSSDCLEVYEVYLSTISTYSFTLEVPVGGDFDLYLYYLSSGEVANRSGCVASSVTPNNGSDEGISNYKPADYGDHVLLVVRSSGSGLYRLSYSFSFPNPFLDFYFFLMLILAGFGIAGLVVALIVIVRKKRRGRPIPYKPPHTHGQARITFLA